MENKIVLSMSRIRKTFPGVVALDNVDFTLRAGEIHALMGENGAGKSTLIKVLTGAEEFETGEIFIDGQNKPIVNHSPQEAQANGISTVYQEVNLCSNLTVAENLFIGREPRRFGMIDWITMRRKSRELLSRLDINVDVTTLLGGYSIAVQQLIAIARAVDISAKVLILDEPTSSLDGGEVEKLFGLMRRLRNSGTGIVFVTHFLEQVYEICDRITVLRNGSLVGEYAVESLPRVQLVAKMMGKDYDDLAEIKKKDVSTVNNEKAFVRAVGLGRTGAIEPFDFEISKGEVVGLTGLLGSGRSELVRSIYSADRPDVGSLEIGGSQVVFKAPIDAMKKGMAYLPEDRKDEGVISDLTVRENIIIALQSKKGIFNLIKRREQEAFAEEFIKLLQIKTSGSETLIKQLSGGNQQKVILARWLLTNPELLILDEPTRGIDIGTKTEIQKLVIKLADEGKSIIFISSEIEEMLRTCDRMAVLRDRRKVDELGRDELSEGAVMKAIAGGESRGESNEE